MKDKDLRQKALKHMKCHKVKSKDIDYVTIGTSKTHQFDIAMYWNFIGALMFTISMIFDHYGLLPGTLFFSAATIFTLTGGTHLLFGRGLTVNSAVMSVVMDAVIVIVATICSSVEWCALEVSTTFTVGGYVDMQLDANLGAAFGALFSIVGIFVADICLHDR